ncbi:MAG: hypothetical protein P8L18_02045 [Verrucomicrobiota bacterium]|nr:hypothetical protein [Verrucomicrobiota bacterium]
MKSRAFQGKHLQNWMIPVFMIIAVISNALVQDRMNMGRSQLGLTRMEPLKNAPPLLAFSSVALGGFRGLIANALWIRATRLQDEGRFFETLSLANWITKLQPTFSSVWTFQSWSMVYNISKQYEDPEERWRWVESGIKLLRDEALAYNPQSSEIYRELAWIFQDKLGANLDAKHLYYKARWAGDIRKLLGSNPNLQAIEEATDPDIVSKREALLNQFGLEVDRMRDIEKALGKFDWRLPETHAIYWAWLGLERSTEGRLNFLRRIIWQSMIIAFERGRLIENEADQSLEYLPNLALAPYTHAMFLKIRREEEDINYYSTIDRAHAQFLQKAAYYHYLHHQLAESAEWFKETKKRFPESIGKDVSLEQFALNRFEASLKNSNVNQARVVVNGLVRQFLHFLSLGEEDQAMGYRNMSELAWRSHQDRIQRASAATRLALPPYDTLLENMVRRIFDGEEGFSEHQVRILRTRIELSEDHPAP